MDLESRQLRYFVQLALDRNYTRAARNLHVAQQTLSESISQLERHLGLKLFDRSPQQVRITQAGLVLLEHAQDLIARSEMAISATRAAARRDAQTISAGSPDWPLGISLFRTAAALYRANRGTNQLVIDPISWTQHVTAIANHRLDVGVTYVADAEDLPQGLTATLLQSEDIGWVLVTDDHPLGPDGTAAVSELAKFSILFIQRHHQPHLHDRLLKILRSEGVNPELEPRNDGPLSAALTHARVSHAAVWVSASMATECPPGLRSVRIPELARELHLAAVSRAGDPNPEVAHFVRALVDAARRNATQVSDA
ncbi:LysR family transcriptional regulator [Actinoplanes sp. CA-030573]|uniref:LysR family transcriptional regulator n=1 Tax=Actinoplanes sp. CA-030573 TaxID=3239898 RepID=UPI003D8C8988